jgi:hypothetical protein
MGGKKRKSAETTKGQNGDAETPPTKPVDVSREEWIFTHINLKKTQSVQKMVPLVPRGGKTKLIPRHVRFGSAVPRACVQEMQSFRCLR